MTSLYIYIYIYIIYTYLIHKPLSEERKSQFFRNSNHFICKLLWQIVGNKVLIKFPFFSVELDPRGFDFFTRISLPQFQHPTLFVLFFSLWFILLGMKREHLRLHSQKTETEIGSQFCLFRASQWNCIFHSVAKSIDEIYTSFSH